MYRLQEKLTGDSCVAWNARRSSRATDFGCHPRRLCDDLPGDPRFARFSAWRIELDKADIELSEGAEATGGYLALWAAVLRNAVVVDRNLAYLDSPDFHFICGTMGMDPSYAARKLRAALANKEPKLHAQARKTSLARDEVEAVPEEPTSHHRPRAKRTHSEATRQKIKAAIARRHADSAAYEAWRAEISEGQKKRWARTRGKMEAA